MLLYINHTIKNMVLISIVSIIDKFIFNIIQLYNMYTI